MSFKVGDFVICTNKNVIPYTVPSIIFITNIIPPELRGIPFSAHSPDDKYNIERNFRPHHNKTWYFYTEDLEEITFEKIMCLPKILEFNCWRPDLIKAFKERYFR